MPRRNRKAQPRRRPRSIEHMVERLTTDQMARQLVANGKASPGILGPLGGFWIPNTKSEPNT